MKISERWLREWVNPDISRERLGEQLTMLGLEIDDEQDAAPDLDGFLVGCIIEAEPHPDADRLQVCIVDIGEAEHKTIVCGAPNARDGLSVAVAPVGVQLPDGTQIKAAKLRGQASEGMLCSAVELGMGTDSAGILELDATAEPGTPLQTHLDLPDTVLEIDLTPDRGDCLSTRGIAREAAVANAIPFVEPEVQPLEPTMAETIDVAIDAPELCAGYAACCVFDLEPAAATPDWLAERLRRGGVRPLSLPVDIANLVMLELGQPMHAFDYDKLNGSIRVRRALSGETIDTLDGGHVELHEGTLVIADDDAPVAIAGMIGGADTAVGETTSRIVFEAACFTPAAVAGQGRTYKIHTDSSHRFERGVDPALYPRAMERASRLLTDLGGGRAGPVVDTAGNPVWAEDRTITLKPGSVERLLGQTIPAGESRGALNALGMPVTQISDDTWQVSPPSWRYDIAIEADLVEEIARVYGYDRLLEGAEGAVLPELHIPESQLAEDELLATLRQRGYSEAITYSFVDAGLQSQLVPDGPRIDLANPIAEQLAQMRETLWASLLPAWEYNRRRQHSNVRLYECGQRFTPDAQSDNGIAQIDTLAGIVDGQAEPRHWTVSGRHVDFFDIKGDVEALLAMGGHEARFAGEQHPALHPGRSAAIYLRGKRIGWLGQLAPRFSKTYKNKELPYLFELDYEALEWRLPIRYKDISEQPRVERDLAVVVADTVAAGDLVATICDRDDAALQNVGVFDVFHPQDLETGYKSVALSLIFQDKERTLTDSAVDTRMEQVAAALKKHYGARIRGV